MNKRWKAPIFALVPGLGHFYLGKHWRGLLVFTLFALGVNGAFGAAVMGEPLVRDLCVGAAASAWAYSVLHVSYFVRRFGREAGRERRDYHFKRGLTQYLAGRFEAAITEFLIVLRLDPMDVDARFHMGMAHAALGQRRKAIQAFRQCLADDFDGKWKWEIGVQLSQLREKG